MKITLQKIFDRAVGGIIEQGGRATDEDGHCMYLSPEGMRCGVGHLIDAEFYDAEVLETHAYDQDGVLDAVAQSLLGDDWAPDAPRRGLSEAAVMLMGDIQLGHDEAAGRDADGRLIHDPTAELRGVMANEKRVARKHGLTWNFDA